MIYASKGVLSWPPDGDVYRDGLRLEGGLQKLSHVRQAKEAYKNDKHYLVDIVLLEIILQ